ncbi:MAG: exodeoxyribonuclease VII small subunit [Saprospiraceae bacterium]
MEEKLSYKSAFELQGILNKIESGDIGIDELGQHIKRANELVQYCKNSLRNIEEDINNTFQEN